MNFEKILRNKPLKLLTLLLTSAIIVTASATVYNYMYMQSFGISVEAAKITFVAGDDSTAAGFSPGTNGTYASVNSMGGWPNATRTYEQACNISATAAVSFELQYDSWSGDTGQVDSMTVIIRNGAGTQQGSTITVGSTSSTGTISIGAGEEWSVEWNIKWNANAQTIHSVDVTLQLIATGE